MPAVAAGGYRWVEVSDNLALVSTEWKSRMVRKATQELGLKVLGEVGKKEGLENTVPLVDNARACIDAGASMVLLEAAELVASNAETAAAVEEVVVEVGLERVMFELPGPWIAGVALHDIVHMRNRLIEAYGPQVNLGSVNPADLMTLEAYRRGLGSNAGGPPVS